MPLVHLSTNLCDKLLVDAEGRHSLIGVFMNLRAPRFPTAKFGMGILVQFRGQPGDHYRVTLEGPNVDPVVLGEGVVDVSFRPEHEFQQWSTSVSAEANPAIFRHPGVYLIALYEGDALVHAHRFGAFQAETVQSEGATQAEDLEEAASA